MVDVERQTVTASTFSSLSEAERQVALSFLLVSEHDAVLDGAWDLVKPAQSGSESLASTTPAEASSSPSTTSQDSSRSPSPSHGTSSPSSSSLLIRSKYQGWERSFELHSDWPQPKIEREDEVLIEHRFVGLNPVDFKSILYNFGIPSSPWVLGRDIAGVVVGTGGAVKGLRVGDRVWTCADARDVRAGAYQRFSVSRSVHLGRVPDILSDEQASTLGTGLVTAAIIAYWFFRWPRNDIQVSNRPWLLIYGGGAITGIYMAQLARIAGLRTIAIASPSNFAYLQSDKVGVDHCINRYDSLDSIKRAVQETVGRDSVSYVVDCVGAKTATLCQDIVLSIDHLETTTSHKTQVVCLAGDPKNVDTNRILLHKISFSTTFYGDDVFARSVLDDLDAYMRSRVLHPVQFEVIADGLAGVRRGLERLRDNQAPRASKLIVNVQETPHAHSTNLGVRAETGWNGVV